MWTLPSAPGTPSAVSTVAGQATVSWAAATDDRATSLTYTVFRDGGPTPVGSVTSASTGTVSFVDVGLAADSVHTWTVRASDGTNTGPSSAASEPVTIIGGTPGLLAQSNFSAGLAGWTGVTNLTVDAGVGSPGDAPPSARVQASNAAATARLALSNTSTAACTEVDLRVTSIGGTANWAPLKVRNAAGSSVGRVWVSPAGAVSVRADVTGAQFTTARTFTFGTWNRVGLCVTIGSQGSLRLTVDGATVGTWAANTGTSPIAGGADRRQRPPDGHRELGPHHGRGRWVGRDGRWLGGPGTGPGHHPARSGHKVMVEAEPRGEPWEEQRWQ